MIRLSLIAFLLFLFRVAAFGQIEIKRDSLLGLPDKFPATLKNEKIDKYLLDDSQIENKFKADYSPQTFNKPTISPIIIPPISYRQDYVLQKDLATKFPYAYDYASSGGYAINDQLAITAISRQDTYMTIGTNRIVNGRLNYAPADWVTFSGGAYGAQYYLFNDLRRDFGFNGSVDFKISDRVKIKGFGQYSVYGRQNHIGGPLMSMFPQTYYGGGMEFKITEKFGVEAGVARELNPMTGKWENVPYIKPVFYSK